jgi:hypothetical protein
MRDALNLYQWVQLDSICNLKTAVEIWDCHASPNTPYSAKLCDRPGRTIGHIAGEGGYLHRELSGADPQRPEP